MKRPRSGGPGMHYGLLYQVFSSLGRALTVSVQEDRRAAQSIVLIVEPSGGDLVETGPKQREVYQYKARSGRRPWSLKDLIDKVLPDLYEPFLPWRTSRPGTGS